MNTFEKLEVQDIKTFELNKKNEFKTPVIPVEIGHVYELVSTEITYVRRWVENTSGATNANVIEKGQKVIIGNNVDFLFFDIIDKETTTEKLTIEVRRTR